MDIQLAVISVHQHAEIIQVILSCIHHGFPYHSLLQFTVAHHAVGIEAWSGSPGDRESLRHADALSHGPGGDLNAGKNRAGMAIENALV